MCGYYILLFLILINNVKGIVTHPTCLFVCMLTSFHLFHLLLFLPLFSVPSHRLIPLLLSIPHESLTKLLNHCDYSAWFGQGWEG